MSLASHRPLSCPPPPPLLPPWQPCTALLTQAATADAAAGKAARKRFAPPFSFPFLLSLSPSSPRGGEEEFFQRAASNLSRDCFVPFLPPIRAMPRNAFYSLRGSARVSRRRLHGCIYITCSSVDISLFFSCFVFFLEWFPLVFGRVDSIGMHDVWSSYSLCRAPFPWMSLGVCADPRLDLAIWFKIFLSLFSSSFCSKRKQFRGIDLMKTSWIDFSRRSSSSSNFPHKWRGNLIFDARIRFSASLQMDGLKGTSKCLIP